MQKSKSLYLYLLLTFFSTFACCPKVSALSENQSNAIKDNCSTIQESLKNVQKKDSRTRVYLGGYFETILSKYIKPLNHRLVENSISDINIINEQTEFANAKTQFSNDFIIYQKSLESLIATNCKENPDDFYDILTTTRALRATVLSDVMNLKQLILDHSSSVQLLEEKI